MVNAGTGANIAMHGNVVEYLCLCLTTICGRWQRAGAPVIRPNTLLPAFTAKAQAASTLRGLGLRRTAAGSRADRCGVRYADRGAGRRDPARGRRPGEGADLYRRQPDGGMAGPAQDPAGARKPRTAGHARHGDVADLTAGRLRHRTDDADGNTGHDDGQRTHQVLHQRHRHPGALCAVLCRASSTRLPVPT